MTKPKHVRRRKKLSAEHQAAFLTMNDPRAKTADRMAAASALMGVMHKPLPVRYVSMAEAEAELAKVFGK